ncbi:GNAT family N-acetyltransferase [Streptomyces narbonensis]|uniref:GNAT family N-acetyltransferase n=1 Tax=Streptomyces narbonensis TaxID=67333 RepID=UPI001E4456DC|nr:GNAT family N-acetyltransferase [Streptomyces narbonensis]
MKISSVATERLVLFPMTVDVAERVVAREPGDGDLWAEGYPGAGDVRALTGLLRGVAERGDPGVFRHYQIRLDGVAVGGIGFHGPPDELGVVTVGYGLVPGARGKGYASEALRALVEVARQGGASGVKGDADLGNPASHRVMEAAGMPCVAESDTLRHFYLGF